VAGTSTGAIVAAALALGNPVDEVRRRYESLGRKVFAKRFPPLRLQALYKDAPLRRELDDFLALAWSLGDPSCARYCWS
jgi:predicted acylesterase/phospholipase RssA